MSTVRIYKSTDPGAPPHPSSTIGSMAALLRACLVDGWTDGEFTAVPAGWEEPFVETNNYACFRALSGARQFYQIDDNVDVDVTVMRSYDSMSDAVTGVGQKGETFFGKWYSAPLSQHWLIVADEKTCYVFLEDNYTYSPHLKPHGFGDFYSYMAEDTENWFFAGHSSSTIMSYDGWSSALGCSKGISDTTATDAIYVGRAVLDDTIKPAKAIIVSAVGEDLKYSLGSYSSSTELGYVREMDPVRISCFEPSENIFRGKLRGWFLAGRYGIGGDGYWSEETIDGVDFILVSSGAYYGTALFIQKGSWGESV